MNLAMAVAGTVLAVMFTVSAAEFAATLPVVKRVLDRISVGSKGEGDPP